MKQLQEFQWLEQSYNLILLGPPGAGKTLLAVGLGTEAIQRGFQVYFIIMGELIQLLKMEEFAHRSQILLKRLRASDLIIIDDVMYMALDQREATLFFQLVDRLLHRVEVIHMNNESHRLKHQQKIFNE